VSAVVLLAHGSPDTRSGDAVREAAVRLAGRSGRTVRVAFLDHDEPRLDRAVVGLTDGDVAVLPLLLSRAFHARVDVPRAVAELPREVDLLDPVGHPTEVLDGLLSRSPGPVVVVAAGTGVVEERDAFADAVAAASARTGVRARHAFLTGPGPSVPQELEERPGAALLAWLLAPGRLLDTLHAHARSAGSEVLAPDGLLAAGVLDEALLARLRPARPDVAR
jgi:sirohydrochlorin ferrochelatase